MSEYPYPLYDEKQKVVCQICGKAFLVISPKHLKTHNVKYADYVNRFPRAPLSNKEFAARGKYGKMKDMFIHPENEEVIGDDILVQEPDIEDFDDVEKFIEGEMKSMDPMKKMKNKIRDHLMLYYANIKMDYMIREFGIDNRLKYEFITDFCDPVLKVVVDFPDTFWHNREAGIDPNKHYKLKQRGWQVFVINSNNPSLSQIDKALGND